ncbi:MAG TPA: ribosomal protein S18-alanine N-acetyltransferase [Lysobacter sp.]
MSAPSSPPEPRATLRPMRESDVDAVHAIEVRAYPFPWTAGIFRDCLRAEYPCWVLVDDGRVIGYFLMSLAADEAHLLNICVAPEAQGAGHGRRMLRAAVQLARGRAQRIFLEVRPSNTGAIALYFSEGFNEIGRRPRYYPAANNGREDALVMAIELLPPE